MSNPIPELPGAACLGMSVAGLHDAYQAKTLSPVEVSTALLDEIEAGDDRIKAFCLLDRDTALQAASASEQRFRRGQSLGPLDGVPISVKDLIDVAGWPTRRGSLVTSLQPLDADAPGVQLLKRAGAVLYGKTTTSEFGWAAMSESPYTGVTHNPWASGKSAGGSSSGAAAHLAMGWGPLALGSDAGGSIRIPAAYCGVTGFKPTFGAIPLAPQGAFAEFAHLGPMARSVADCRAAMRVLSQPDPRDPTSLFPRGPVATTPRPVLGYAIDRSADLPVDPAIEQAVLAQVERLRKQGYTVKAVSIDWTGLADIFWDVWQDRIFESQLSHKPAERAMLDPRLQAVYELGAALSNRALVLSRRRLRAAIERMVSLFVDIDLLLTPATPMPAPDLGMLCDPTHPQRERIDRTNNWLLACPYAFPFNITQQPALTLPLGRTADGLPFGLQIVGRKYSDDLVLDFGEMVEAALDRQR